MAVPFVEGAAIMIQVLYCFSLFLRVTLSLSPYPSLPLLNSVFLLVMEVGYKIPPPFPSFSTSNFPISLSDLRSISPSPFLLRLIPGLSLVRNRTAAKPCRTPSSPHSGFFIFKRLEAVLSGYERLAAVLICYSRQFLGFYLRFLLRVFIQFNHLHRLWFFTDSIWVSYGLVYLYAEPKDCPDSTIPGPYSLQVTSFWKNIGDLEMATKKVQIFIWHLLSDLIFRQNTSAAVLRNFEGRFFRGSSLLIQMKYCRYAIETDCSQWAISVARMEKDVAK